MINSILISMGAITLVILILQWMMPHLINPLIPFGVHVPPERRSDPAVQKAQKFYRLGIVLTFVISCLLWIGCFASLQGATDSPVAFVIFPIVPLLLGFVCYYTAHRMVAGAKQRGNWMAGHKQVVVMETNPEKYRQRVSWLWSVPTLLMVVASVVVGAILYPHIPQVFPAHYNANGQVDRFAHKSVLSVFNVVFLQVFLFLLMCFIHVRTIRQLGRIYPTNPEASLKANAVRNARFIRATWMLFFFINLSFFWTNLNIWQLVDVTPGRLMTGIMVPLLLGLIVLIPAMRYGRTAEVEGDRTSPVPQDDDRYWYLGGIYVNSDDPRWMVQKRFGIGWTLNFAHPWAWGLLAIILLVPIGISLLAGR